MWSFGILTWEIFTLGGRPYETWPDEAVIDNLKEGEREEQPESCPDELWGLVLEGCWAGNPSDREAFSDIKVPVMNYSCVPLYHGYHSYPIILP